MGTAGQTFNEETSKVLEVQIRSREALMEEVQLNQTFMRGHCPKERMPERYNLRMLLPRFLCTKSGTEDSQTARADFGGKQVFEDVKTRRQDSSTENVMRMDAVNKFMAIVFVNFLPDQRK